MRHGPVDSSERSFRKVDSTGVGGKNEVDSNPKKGDTMQTEESSDV